MERLDFLEAQGLFTQAHRDLKERFGDTLEGVSLATSQTGPTPMFREQGDTVYVSPVGALALASGATLQRSAHPTVFTLDGGTYTPGAVFTERTGWHPTVPFSLEEIERYAQDEADAGLFLKHFQTSVGSSFAGWSSWAHLGSLSNPDPAMLLNLLALNLRSMYDPWFKPSRQMRDQFNWFERLEKRSVRKADNPYQDWMHPVARRMLKFFTA